MFGGRTMEGDVIETSRRSLITGLISLIAAPAIVRASSLMPVKGIPVEELKNPRPWKVIYESNPDVSCSTYFQGRFFWVTYNEPQVIHWANADPGWKVMEGEA